MMYGEEEDQKGAGEQEWCWRAVGGDEKEKGAASYMYDVILKLVTFHANLKNDWKNVIIWKNERKKIDGTWT